MQLRFWKRTSALQAPEKKKSVAREWADAVMFAVVVASIIRWASFEAYAIPTPSMEKSLLVGDYLFVSKLHYGPRTPGTPLQVPLTHQTIWGTEIPAYSDAIQLPFFRLPGFSEIKRNDAVVFNFPIEKEHPIDLKTYFIKRCIGIAGDTIALRDRQVYINGKATENPEELQYSYFLQTDRMLNQKFFADRAITDSEQHLNGYVVHTSPAKAAALAQLDFVKEITLLELKPKEPEPGAFPEAPAVYTWNRDNFGPLYIPKAGATIAITPETLLLYKQVILVYEQQVDAAVENGKLYIGGKEQKQYTFRQNYYFMMGDNRHNSLDSRYWGFVPEDHIVGKAVLVWNSIDPAGSFGDKIRWNRLFTQIK